MERSGRGERILAAEHTLKVFRKGFYDVDDKRVEIASLHRNTAEHSFLYTAEMIDIIPESIIAYDKTKSPVYELTQEPTLLAIKRLYNEGERKLGALNFASPFDPGGEFRSGRVSQEQSLAMCSNLVYTQLENFEFYKMNHDIRTPLHSDYMIFSKDVVFIKENPTTLFSQPIICSIISAPAVDIEDYVHAGGSRAMGLAVMQKRVHNVVKLFAFNKISTIILGAFGCGGAKNQPEEVAQIFYNVLKKENMQRFFNKIVFALYDNNPKRKIFEIFKDKLEIE